MITDTFNALYIVEKIKGFFKTPTGVFLYAVTTSVAGVLILLMFLSTVLAPSTLLFILPAIVAFNAAAGGYGLADKKNLFSYQKTGLSVLATFVALTGSLATSLFFPWEPLLAVERLFISIAMALLAAAFGAWIAGKSRTINQPVYQPITGEEIS
ncbi:hypothetical protein [Desulfopila sp. IMCC35008]|uniref:hypothetical protein n=1 Tax=Desulfopila sp. IMCC35008 TaxID=2653858 RepID=UPI0013D7246B|nr:hypothetical protein [Desulfopila sp. IMCC35008]